MSKMYRYGMIARATQMNTALSEPVRMKIMKVLGSAEVNTYSVSDIAKILKMSQSTATKHLQILNNAGFIVRERIGSSVFYSVSQEGLDDYRKIIDCAFIAQKTPCVNDYDCLNCPLEEDCNSNFTW